jgi:hypothetical protein
MCPERVEGFRPPSAAERELLERLLGADFQGGEGLRRQLLDTVVQPIDLNGSLRLRPLDATPVLVARRIPVEANYADADGVTVHVLVHVIGGALNELEVYREDSGDVMVAPTSAARLAMEPWIE